MYTKTTVTTDEGKRFRQFGNSHGRQTCIRCT